MCVVNPTVRLRELAKRSGKWEQGRDNLRERERERETGEKCISCPSPAIAAEVMTAHTAAKGNEGAAE